MRFSSNSPALALERKFNDRAHLSKLASLKSSFDSYESAYNTRNHIKILKNGYFLQETQRRAHINNQNKIISSKIHDIILSRQDRPWRRRIPAPGSLNYLTRKSETLRIKLENTALVKRLSEYKSNINTKEIISDYKKNCVLKKRLSKVSLTSRLKRIDSQLMNKESKPALNRKLYLNNSSD